MKAEQSLNQDIHDEKILVIDLGHPFAQLVARSVRAGRVYSEIFSSDITTEQIKQYNPKGIIITSGPDYIDAIPKLPAALFQANVPVLAIGGGMQAMLESQGGELAPKVEVDNKHIRVRARGHSDLLRDLQDAENSQGHGLLDVALCASYRPVKKLPEGFYEAATHEELGAIAVANDTLKFYGIHFHPAIAQTPKGHAIIGRFVHDICGCNQLWESQAIIDTLIEKIRQQVGSDRVLLGLSGGVDSSVAAALLHKAIGDQLNCVFVDHGLLRLNEAKSVMQTFGKNMGVNVKQVDAEDIFLAKLKGVNDPEQKRKIIGNTFIEIFDENANQFENIKWLGQGTIYPDVIESGGANGEQEVVKSHHNVGGLPEDMKLGLVEPLRELFKDEVRELGLALGLPRDMVMRHPFPGPGIGVRILGEIKKSYADTLRLADDIFIDELRKADWYDRVSQAFAIYLPVSSVGVIDGKRRYEHVIALRAIETVDFMTARWAHLPYELIDRAVNRIVQEVPGISRVVYDVTGKPPGTIEWE